uniref:Retrovirus-related Pol polyprotein from transposon TNT 1-94 n=1 Tax=Tanacetum cinerariifolium TaxID=118510 RepID=A0A699GYU4_TANCI|nr:hypothetical protein [Tanacetum cinerariifolium]
MAFTEEERVAVSKACAINREWVRISIRKVHTLLEVEDNKKRKYFLDYLCIDLNYVEEQRNHLLSKHKDLVQTLNTYKEQLLVLKQAKLDCTTMQHASTEILKENKNLRKELNEPKSNTKTWLSSSKQVNQILPAESQRNSTDPPVAVIDSSESECDSTDESSVCFTSFPPLEKPSDVEPISGPKTVKTTLKLIYTFKTKALKGIIPNEPSSALAQENKNASTSKSNSSRVGNSKNVKTTDYLHLATVIKRTQ